MYEKHCCSYETMIKDDGCCKTIVRLCQLKMMVLVVEGDCAEVAVTVIAMKNDEQ